VITTGNLETAYQKLKDAAAEKDAVQVKILAVQACALEAVKFSQQAAAIQGPLAQQAWHNAQVMKDEAARMR
jgi:hypothetical protein